MESCTCCGRCHRCPPGPYPPARPPPNLRLGPHGLCLHVHFWLGVTFALLPGKDLRFLSGVPDPTLNLGSPILGTPTLSQNTSTSFQHLLPGHFYVGKKFLEGQGFSDAFQGTNSSCHLSCGCLRLHLCIRPQHGSFSLAVMSSS